MPNEGDEKSTTVVVPIATRARRTAARKTTKRKAAAGKPGPRRAARRKPARRSAASRPVTIESVIRSITGGVAVARAAIAEASGQGATAVRRAVGTASKSSRRTVTRLANEWKAMDARKKARILAALLGAAAAASAPIVRRTLKK